MQQELEAAFGNCKRLATSPCAIASSYEFRQEPTFYVYDELNDHLNYPVRVVTENEYYQLTVENNTDDGIWLVKSDKCLFTDEIQKCDCLVFNADKFFFVEIKTSSAGGRNKKRQKAVEQLASTIKALIDAGIDFSGYQEVRAIICFKRNDVYPIRASFNTQRATFSDEFKISLDEGNLLTF